MSWPDATRNGRIGSYDREFDQDTLAALLYRLDTASEAEARSGSRLPRTAVFFSLAWRPTRHSAIAFELALSFSLTRTVLTRRMSKQPSPPCSSRLPTKVVRLSRCGVSTSCHNQSMIPHRTCELEHHLCRLPLGSNRTPVEPVVQSRWARCLGSCPACLADSRPLCLVDRGGGWALWTAMDDCGGPPGV